MSGMRVVLRASYIRFRKLSRSELCFLFVFGECHPVTKLVSHVVIKCDETLLSNLLGLINVNQTVDLLQYKPLAVFGLLLSATCWNTAAAFA